MWLLTGLLLALELRLRLVVGMPSCVLTALLLYASSGTVLGMDLYTDARTCNQQGVWGLLSDLRCPGLIWQSLFGWRLLGLSRQPQSSQSPTRNRASKPHNPLAPWRSQAGPPIVGMASSSWANVSFLGCSATSRGSDATEADDAVAQAFRPVLPGMLASAYEAGQQSPEVQPLSHMLAVECPA